MKIGKSMKILTPLVAAMFILSLFSGAVAAQTQSETLEKDDLQYKMYKEKYEKTKDEFEKAKEGFENANKKFQLAKTRINKDELEKKTKEYLLKAIDHSISQLEVLKTKVLNSQAQGISSASAVIDAHIAQLQQLRTKVQDATTIDELRNANQELKNQWEKIRLETKYYLGIVINERIDAFITKAENVSKKLDDAVQKLESEGKDVTQLKEDTKKYNDILTEAKSMQDKTDALFNSHDGFDSNGSVIDKKAAQAFIQDATNSQKETIRKLRELSRQLVEFVKEFRKLGRVSELGTSTKTTTTGTANNS